MTRPEYKDADAKDRVAYIGSRNNVLSKSFVTDLWMKVIHRAIDDIVAYRIAKESNKKIKDEELESVNDAYGFLFHDEYKIPFDDYMVNVECSECKIYFMSKMSEFASGLSSCNSCNKIQNINISSYEITEGMTIKEINLREILQFWAIEDMNGFREGVRERIEELMERKKKAIAKRLALKEKKMEQKKKEKTNNIILQSKVKIVCDKNNEQYVWRVACENDTECILVNNDTVIRWMLMDELHSLFQKELSVLYKKSKK